MPTHVIRSLDRNALTNDQNEKIFVEFPLAQITSFIACPETMHLNEMNENSMNYEISEKNDSGGAVAVFAPYLSLAMNDKNSADNEK